MGSTRGNSRSDLYSLGITAYDLLTRRPPFAYSSLTELVRQIREDLLARPNQHQSAIAELFEGAVLRLPATQRENRHQSTSQLRDDLQRVAK